MESNDIDLTLLPTAIRKGLDIALLGATFPPILNVECADDQYEVIANSDFLTETALRRLLEIDGFKSLHMVSASGKIRLVFRSNLASH